MALLQVLYGRYGQELTDHGCVPCGGVWPARLTLAWWCGFQLSLRCAKGRRAKEAGTDDVREGKAEVFHLEVEVMPLCKECDPSDMLQRHGVGSYFSAAAATTWCR